MSESIPVLQGTRRENEIVRGVYYQDETETVLNHETGEDVPVWRYQWLDADGVVLSHGDPYLSEEHVVAAMQGVLADHEATVPIEQAAPGRVDPLDEQMGRISATGSAHCKNCGAKIAPEVVNMVRRAGGMSAGCPQCGTAVPTADYEAEQAAKAEQAEQTEEEQ